jgi:CBS domain-containing protein
MSERVPFDHPAVTAGDHPPISVSRPVRVIGSASSVADALDLMQRTRVRHLPVVENGYCLGLLIDRDVIAAALEGVEPRLGRLCRGPAPTVGVDATPGEVARAILAGGLDAALVLDDGELAGIVTTTDALVALAGADRSTAVGDRRATGAEEP